MQHPLDLRSPRWSELAHAYGSAVDTPSLLGAVASDPGPKSDWQSEPWFTLWSSLCHQGDVYSASFAAVPHLVAVGVSLDVRCAVDFIHLPTRIEVGRLRGDVAVPADLVDAYSASIAELPKLVAQQAKHVSCEEFTRVAAAAIAASAGQPDLADAFEGLDPSTLADLLADKR